jgi:hypothetical protein
MELIFLPTDGAFKVAFVPFEVGGNGADIGVAFQTYGGIGPEETLYIRSFKLERTRRRRAPKRRSLRSRPLPHASLSSGCGNARGRTSRRRAQAHRKMGAPGS